MIRILNLIIQYSNHFLHRFFSIKRYPVSEGGFSIMPLYKYGSTDAQQLADIESFLNVLEADKNYAIIIVARTTVGMRSACSQLFVHKNTSPEDLALLVNFYITKLALEYPIVPNTDIMVHYRPFSHILSEKVSDEYIKNRLSSVIGETPISNANHLGMVNVIKLLPSSYKELTSLPYVEDTQLSDTSGKLYRFTRSFNLFINDEINISEGVQSYDFSLVSIEGSTIQFTDELDLKTNTLCRKMSNVTFYYKDGKLDYFAVDIKTNFIPKVNRTSKKDIKIGTFDIETYPLTAGSTVELRPYAIAFYDGVSVNSYYLSDYKNDIEMITEALSGMLSPKYKGFTFFAHNMSGFDGVFILDILSNFKDINIQPIMRDNTILCLIITYKGCRFYIKDSLHFLPSKLSTLCDKYEVEVHKGVFPHSFAKESLLNYVGPKPSIKYYEDISFEEYASIPETFNFRVEATNYLAKDVISLHQVISTFTDEIYVNYGITLKNCVSIASVAFKLFKAKFLPANIIPIVKGRVYKCISQAYYGGRAEVFKPYTDKTLYGYDVNSLYPRAMLEDMPVGSPRYVSKVKDISQFFGFCHVTVKTPDNIYNPILPYRLQSGGYINPVGMWQGWYFSEEIKVALEHGYSFEFHEGYEFSRGKNLFQDYIEHFYSIKCNQSGVAKEVAKLMLNSLYGRFGMGETHPKCSIVNMAQFDAILAAYNLIDFIRLPSGKTIVKYDLEHDDTLFKDRPQVSELLESLDVKVRENQQSVGVAAAITAYARIIMNKHLKDESIYYTDTDSIYTDVQLPDNLISSKIGEFKLESEGIGGIFVAPKLYLIKLSNNVFRVRSRGIPSKLLSLMDFLHLLNGIVINKTVTKWFKSLTESTVLIKNVEVKLTKTLNKRIKIYDENNVWVDTKSHTVFGSGVLSSKGTLQGSKNHEFKEASSNNFYKKYVKHYMSMKF